MKNVFLVGGTMGVGKTAACQRMKALLPRSVFLDGDWCWDASPFQVTEETKRMVQENICFLLNNFIRCTAYDNVIFCWVMHEQGIIDMLARGLNLEGVNLVCASLLASEETLRERLGRDIAKGVRARDVLERSIARIPLYAKLNTARVDTNGKTVDEIAREVAALAGANGNPEAVLA